jgi:hypothetical protein
VLNSLYEINENLPNGLHDAEVEKIAYDLTVGLVSIDLLVWVGTMDDPPETRKRYRRGTLQFRGVVFFAKLAPRDGNDAGLTILSFERNADLSPDFRSGAPSTDNTYRIFTGASEFDIECAACGFKWTDDIDVNRGLDQIN